MDTTGPVFLEVSEGLSDSVYRNSHAERLVEVSGEPDLLEPIAIVGYAIRFPQEALSPEAFWKIMVDGINTSSGIPKDRFNQESFYHQNPNRTGTMNVKGGHFLKSDIAEFDAPFFSITPAEAACMDPQQRLLLETAYRALENAGMQMEKVYGSKTSVSIGSFTNDYKLLLEKDPQTSAKYLATGTEAGMLANRLSWFFNFGAPSLQIDTACSSSLNALHLACQGLRDHDADMGVVGGCNLFYNPESMLSMTDLNLLSPDGICYSFDWRANGYARGEGFGVVVIKLLSKAIEDGDTIRAIIRATGSNQDGRTPAITQPSGEAQAALIRETYRKAGLDPGVTRFFEAHGTGTPVGDPIEASAIHAVFGHYRSPKDPLLVGAVKSNIGHLEGASGIAGLIKTIMVLEKGIIPQNACFERVNPNIPMHEWNLEFPRRTIVWPGAGIRRASVNSFGFGGANAHVVLDDAYNFLRSRGMSGKHCTVRNVATHLCSKSRSNESLNVRGWKRKGGMRPLLFTLSSSDEAGINRLASAYDEYFLTLPEHHINKTFMENLAFTLSEKRSQLPWKSTFLASATSELKPPLSDRCSKPTRSMEKQNLGYIFTGQGAHWWAMGRELMRYETFKESLSAADKYLSTLGCEWSLIDELLSERANSKLDDLSLTQPICTALQVALVQLLRNWNVTPSAVLGHSSGEIAAAYAAGSISRESAWKIAYYRGFLARRLCSTRVAAEAMMSVGLSEDEMISNLQTLANDIQTGSVAIACINSPQNVTLSGDASQIDAIRTILSQREIFARKLNVGIAYHSKSMDAIASEYQTLIGNIESGTEDLAIPIFISSLTGLPTSAGQLQTADYWVQNLTQPVQFSKAVLKMCTPLKTNSRQTRQSVDHILEIGPHSALRIPIRDILKSINQYDTVAYNSLLIKDVCALQSSLKTAGNLYCSGVPVKLTAINFPAGSEEPQMLTDAPYYPFNHGQQHWIESRLSKSFRFREHAEHELLGSTVPDWNILDARWRKIVRLSDTGWVTHHIVNNTILYPGAGMIVLAIEAAKYLADPAKKVSGFRVEDVTFSKAIMLSPDRDGVEIEISLRQVPGIVTKSSSWREFCLHVYEDPEWSECCRGTVVIEYSNNDSSRDFEEGENLRESDTHCRALDARCRSSIAPNILYKNLKKSGLEYGPTFQVLSEVTFDRKARNATASVHPCNWDQDGFRTLVVHPTAMDGVFQLMVLALARGDQLRMSAMLPTRLKRMWIAGMGISNPQSDGGTARAYVNAAWEGMRTAMSSAIVLDSSTSTPAIVISGLQATSVENLEASTDATRGPLCYSMSWKPDIQLLSRTQIEQYCNAATDSEMSVKCVELLELGAAVLISKTLLGMCGKSQVEPKPHLQKYLTWMRSVMGSDYLASMCAGKYGTWMDIARDSKLQDEIIRLLHEGDHPDGKLILRLGEHLPDIISGNMDALELLFADDLMDTYYVSQLMNSATSKLASYLELFAHKFPASNILEVGGGTGGMTKFILKTLTNHHTRDACFTRYTFTDISASFFEKARTIFQGQGHRVAFQTLDLEKNALEQGYEAGTYDLVIASNTLHATKSIAYTLQNIRPLLKPGGRLILFELTIPETIRTTFVFGVLAGWWLSTEDFRKNSPLLTPSHWKVALRENGYNGIDFHWPDHKDDGQRDNSVIIATASDHDVAKSLKQIPDSTLIIIDDGSSVQLQIAQEITSSSLQAENQRYEVIVVDDLHLNIRTTADYIFLCETERAVLPNMTERLFVALKQVFQSSRIITWVTNKSCSVAEDPNSDSIIGLARALRSEGVNVRFTTLALENTDSAHLSANIIVQAHTTTVTTVSDDYEPEYESRHGALYINRIVEDKALSTHVACRTIPQVPVPQTLGDNSNRGLALTVGSPGLLNTLEFQDERPERAELASDEMEVKVKASGLIFRDVLIALGVHDDTQLGLEFAGVVVKRGPDVPFLEGDRVCGWSHGAMKTYVRCKAITAALLPADLSFETAAALPVAYCTAYHSLVQVAHIRRGDTVLIHSAAGGTGQAAIQIARLFGAEIFATVGNEEKRQVLKSEYGIAGNHIFSSRATTFRHAIKRATNGCGVDIILNSLTDEALLATYECLAPFGTFVEFGRRDRGSLAISNFRLNGTFSVVDMSHMLEHDPALLGRTMTAVMRLIEDRSLFAPRPLSIYRASQMEEAFRHMQSGKSSGKLVISMDEDDTVQVVPRLVSDYDFDHNSTYVIAGGLGGIGQSISRWMVSRGARYLILLSRSTTRSESTREFIDDLQKEGAIVATPTCDIADEAALKSVLHSQMQVLPPIRGCIQSTLALYDTPFESMTLTQFQIPLHPKIAGSWNLHTLLPQALDFFVLLSSGSGIVGSRSQANYASGNTFQDALARHRVAAGQRAYAIDLGVVSSVGYAAERQQVTDYLVAQGYGAVAEHELLALLDACCDARRPLPASPEGAQVITGMETASALAAAGIPEPFWMVRPLFRHVRNAGRGSIVTAEAQAGDGSDADAGLRVSLAAAASLDAAAEAVLAGLVRKLSRALGVSEREIDAGRPAHAYGVDSLGAVEVRNWMARKIGADVPVFRILGSTSIREIAMLAAKASDIVRSEIKAGAECPPD